MLLTTRQYLRKAQRAQLKARAELHTLAVSASVRFDIVAGTKFGTAAWHFDRGTHRIAIDEHFEKSLEVRPSVGAQRLRYMANLVRHETLHGLYSGGADAVTVIQEARAAGIDLSLLNIAEDCRIEHISRPGYGPFQWLKFHERHVAISAPAHWLLERKQHDGETLPARRWKGDKLTARKRSGVADALRPTVDVLDEFYAEIVACPTMRDMLPVLRDFVETFPGSAFTDDERIPVSVRERIAGTGYSPEGVPVLVAETIYGKVREQKEQAATYRVVGMDFYERSVSLGETVRLDNFDDVRAAIDDTFRVDGGALVAATSGSRLHTGNAMRGESSAFRRVSARRAPRLALIVDMSGSMRRQYVEHGGQFILAMHEATQAGAVDADIIFSGGNRSAIVPRDYPADKLARVVPCHGSESIRDTLAAHREIIEGADAVIVYTDGCITDGIVNAGDWRARGVNLRGACVASGPRRERLSAVMLEHFGSAILAPSGVELARRIVADLAESRRND